MSEELLPCPRCGGEIVIELAYGTWWEWLCKGCGATCGTHGSYGWTTRAEAIADANRRVPSRTEADDNGCMSSAGFIPPIGTGGKS